jgi:hypothetical protein
MPPKDTILSKLIFYAMIIMLIWFMLFMLSGCLAIQKSNEKYYYKKTIQIIDSLPEETKQLCGYSFNRDFPNTSTSDKSVYLFLKEEVKYNPQRPVELVHEYQHFFNRQGASWSCLNEVSASYAERIIHLQIEIERLEARNKLSNR